MILLVLLFVSFAIGIMRISNVLLHKFQDTINDMVVVFMFGAGSAQCINISWYIVNGNLGK